MFFMKLFCIFILSINVNNVWGADFSNPVTPKGVACVSVDTLSVSEPQEQVYRVDVEIIGHCIEKMRVKVCPTRSESGCEEYLLPAGERIKTRLYTKSKASMVSYKWAFYDTPPATRSHAISPNWNYLDASYLSADIGSYDPSIEADGFGVNASTLVGGNIILDVSYSYISEDNLFNTNIDGEITNATLGIGYRYGATDSTDVFILASYLYSELDLTDSDGHEVNDVDGYTLTLGLRSMLTESFEGAVIVGYGEVEGISETALGFSAHYHFNKQYSVGVGYSVSDDVDLYNTGVKISF